LQKVAMAVCYTVWVTVLPQRSVIYREHCHTRKTRIQMLH